MLPLYGRAFKGGRSVSNGSISTSMFRMVNTLHLFITIVTARLISTNIEVSIAANPSLKTTYLTSTPIPRKPYSCGEKNSAAGRLSILQTMTTAIWMKEVGRDFLDPQAHLPCPSLGELLLARINSSPCIIIEKD